MYCSECGSYVVTDAKFCNMCGIIMSEETMAEKSNGRKALSTGFSKASLICSTVSFGILLVVIALAVLAMALVLVWPMLGLFLMGLSMIFYISLGSAVIILSMLGLIFGGVAKGRGEYSIKATLGVVFGIISIMLMLLILACIFVSA